jgi:hypothetical protein
MHLNGPPKPAEEECAEQNTGKQITNQNQWLIHAGPPALLALLYSPGPPNARRLRNLRKGQWQAT